ncbi:hypothetical protein OIO90_001300 [Microbotryomycetes sp. JL221]|nr:hypothetical protein OIO90_001300 [Microbotryomycetes sp. JL221]
MVKAFALGLTGYIGGNAMHGIFAKHPELDISALVRNSKDDEAIKQAFNARIVRGSLSDVELIEQESSNSDFVLNFADADDLKVVEAILSGLKRRSGQQAGSQRKPIYLHTSGTSVIAQGNDGSFVKAAENVFDDNKEADVKGIPPTAMHREIDLAIFKANDEGYVDAFIIAPSMIYAKGSGPVRDRSAQIPSLIQGALLKKQPIRVGDGTAVWNGVHAQDLEQLYTLVASLALSGKDNNSSWGRFYVGAGEEHSWGEIVDRLADLLYARGKIDSKEVLVISREEGVKINPYIGSTATNSRSVANRGKALGWKPRQNGLWDEIEDDVDGVLAQM